MIGSLSQGLYKGHVEKLGLYLNEKMTKIEFLYEGNIKRRNMGKS